MLLSARGHQLVHAATGLELRILCDGRDITDNCIAADDVHGWATVYPCDEYGRRQFVPHPKHREIACAVLVVGVIEFAIYEDAQPVLRRIPRLIETPLVVLH